MEPMGAKWLSLVNSARVEKKPYLRGLQLFLPQPQHAVLRCAERPVRDHEPREGLRGGASACTTLRETHARLQLVVVHAVVADDLEVNGNKAELLERYHGNSLRARRARNRRLYHAHYIQNEVVIQVHIQICHK